jgi:hypothetical protein
MGSLSFFAKTCVQQGQWGEGIKQNVEIPCGAEMDSGLDT